THLDGSLSSDNIGIVNWTWKLSDSGVDIVLYGMENSYVFNQPGKYRILLNVSDAAGNFQESPLNITVKDLTDPVIEISSLSFDEGEVATFDGSRCTDNVGIVNWTWTFDDGGVSRKLFGEFASHIFSEHGEYRVHLTVMDEAGNSATNMMVVTIHDDGSGEFLRDHWWIVPILLVVLILILAFLLFKRGKIMTGSSEPIPAETTKASPPISTDERSV
ncbi:MAG: PKD domain-containing protein, partial [Candidatus Thermoplasmatota archaeon]|nr:PKD domain-containing protein [Candidatus Thermoplasmatota archaeon]